MLVINQLDSATFRPLEVFLNLPGFNQLKNFPFLKAAFTPPVSVENVSIVATCSALGSVIELTKPETSHLQKYLSDMKSLNGTISAEDITALASVINGSFKNCG